MSVEALIFEATVEQVAVAEGIGSYGNEETYLFLDHPVIKRVQMGGSLHVRSGDRLRIYVDPERVGKRKAHPTSIDKLPEELTDGVISNTPVFRIDVVNEDGTCAATYLSKAGWYQERDGLLKLFQ